MSFKVVVVTNSTIRVGGCDSCMLTVHERFCELSPNVSPLKVTCVCPGLVQTIALKCNVGDTCFFRFGRNVNRMLKSKQLRDLEFRHINVET